MFSPVLLRKIFLVLAVLVGTGSLILLSRTFWDHPEDRPITRMPVETAIDKNPSSSKPVEVKKEAEEPKHQVPTKNTGLKEPAPLEANQKVKSKEPATPIKRNSAPQAPAPEDKSSVAAPLRQVKKEPVPKETMEKNFSSSPARPVAESDSKRPADQVMTVKKGDSLYSIAAKTYHIANTSIVEQILILNPKMRLRVDVLGLILLAFFAYFVAERVVSILHA
jgi:cytoskeletal protein RodZ